MKLLNNLYKVTFHNSTPEATTYSISFLSECVIYKAHFPTEPVTPGVCLVQIAVELLSEHCGHTLHLIHARNLKFLSIVTPSTHLDVVLSKIQPNEDNQVSCQVQLKDTETVYSKFSIICSQR